MTTRSRTPFRLALEQLTDAFARAILEAVRRATLAEILETDAAPTVRRPRTALAPAPLRVHGAVRPRHAPTVRDAEVADPGPAASHDGESEAAAGTEIDAVAMLESLERQASALDEPARPELPALLQAEPPAERGAPIAMRTPALRDGEDVLRTATGAVVLRRRRASKSAA